MLMQYSDDLEHKIKELVMQLQNMKKLEDVCKLVKLQTIYNGGCKKWILYGQRLSTHTNTHTSTHTLTQPYSQVVLTGANALFNVFSAWEKLYPLISKYKAKKNDDYTFDDVDELSTVDTLINEHLVNNNGTLDMKKILATEDAKQDKNAKTNHAWSGSNFFSVLTTFVLNLKNI